MKTNMLLLLLALISAGGFSQNTAYAYNGRYTLSVKQEKIKDAQSITDLTPELWQKLALPYKERDTLEYQRQMTYAVGYYLYPKGGYATAIDYVSVEISATSNGRLLTAQSNSGLLTSEQKNILNAAGLGSNVRVKISFNYKNPPKGSAKYKIVDGYLTLTVVPENEAEYPGGFKKLTAYLTGNVLDKIPAKATSVKIHDAVVNFTVNEQGQIVNAKLSQTSADPKADQLILDAIAKMPLWKPATNSKGMKVKEEFNIPLGNGGDGC